MCAYDVPTSDAPIGAKKRARKRLVKATQKMIQSVRRFEHGEEVITLSIPTKEWYRFADAINNMREEVKRGT